MASKFIRISTNGALKCDNCTALTAKLDALKEMVEKQQHQSEQQTLNICDILSEHKVLLNQVLSKNQALDSVMEIFPLHSESKLSELNSIIATQKDMYVRYLKSLIKGNINKNLHEIFGKEIIMGFNTDGTHGKKKLKEYKYVFNAILEAIADDLPEEKFRMALQKEKKKYFKLASKTKAKENLSGAEVDEISNTDEISAV